MSKVRLFSSVAVAAALLLPTAVVSAQEDAEASAAPGPSAAAVDTRLPDLEALVPTALAGLPLDENLQLATGEQMATVMSPEEMGVLEALLEANDAVLTDYAAASTWLPLSDIDVVVIQAHRIAGVPAALTLDPWIEILSLSTTEPEVTEISIAGRAVTRMSDAANEAAPPLHLFPAGDVVWMLWSDDLLLVEKAMDEVGADAAGEAAP